MRHMATDAALHLTCLVFENERAALVHMALEAGLLVPVGLVQHLVGLTHGEGGRETAMRVVTIGA